MFINVGEDDLFPWFDFKRKKHAEDFVAFVNAGRIDREDWKHIQPDDALYRCYEKDKNWDEVAKVSALY